MPSILERLVCLISTWKYYIIELKRIQCKMIIFQREKGLINLPFKVVITCEVERNFSSFNKNILTITENYFMIYIKVFSKYFILVIFAITMNRFAAIWMEMIPLKTSVMCTQIYEILIVSMV